MDPPDGDLSKERRAPQPASHHDKPPNPALTDVNGHRRPWAPATAHQAPAVPWPGPLTHNRFGRGVLAPSIHGLRGPALTAIGGAGGVFLPGWAH